MNNTPIMLISSVLTFILVLSSTSSVSADQKNGSSKASKAPRALWDTRMFEACDGISRRYKLDSVQKDRTCTMITERTSKVLQKYDKVLWSTLAELAPYQVTGDLPDAETARRIAKDAYPIFLEAQQEILKAQDDFRQLLNEDQKKIHDKDLKNLRRTFSQMERTFSDWKRGNVRNLGSINPPTAEGRRLFTDERKKPLAEDKWDSYVAKFVADYRLDNAQKGQALSVLSDLKVKAAQYRRSNNKEINEAASLLREVQARRPIDLEELEQAKLIVELYQKPFGDWFSELKERLSRIPREQQQREHDKRFPQKQLAPKQKQAATADS